MLRWSLRNKKRISGNSFQVNHTKCYKNEEKQKPSYDGSYNHYGRSTVDFPKIYRKTSSCNMSGTQLIYRDNYQKCANNTCITEDTSSYNKRTLQPIIRSGLQYNKEIQKYSFNYNEYLKNRNKTFEQNKPAAIVSADSNQHNVSKPRYNSCDSTISGVYSCSATKKVTHKKRNKNYYTNSAVSSSTRLDRIKNELLRKNPRTNSKCSNSSTTNCSTRRIVYDRIQRPKDLFNENHSELKCSQNNALLKARGRIPNPYKNTVYGNDVCE